MQRESLPIQDDAAVTLVTDPFRLQHILFPVDLSEASRNTVPFAREIARRFNAELTVMHVLELPAGYYMPPDAAGWDTLTNVNEYRETRKCALEAFIAEELPHAEVIPEFAEGDAAREIVHFAREKKADLIMIPTHGYGTFRRFLLGSVTAKVLHEAQCPVWTSAHIQEGVSALAKAPRRIVCAVHDDEDAAHVIGWAADFAKPFDAEVQVVCDVPNLPEKAIPDAVYEFKADLLIIGRGKMNKPFGGFRSHGYRIVRESPCPVISI